MKIAFVYDAVFPWVMGGAQKRVWELASRLSERHDVHWYGQKYWDDNDTIKREGVTLHGVCEPKDLYVDDRRSIKQALYFTLNLIPEIVGNDYDVIDCQEFPYFPCYVSLVSSVFKDTNLFITWYEVWGDYWYDYLGNLGLGGKLIESSIARFSATHITTSQITQDDLIELGAKDTRVSPLGIDFEELRDVDPVEENIDLLFGARLIPEKNAELFVESVAKIIERGDDIEALIIGEGPERENIGRRISELKIEDSVEVIDFVDHDEFLGYIKAADVFAFPSQREGFGLVGLEALACGTPVVTSNHPQNAAQELIEHARTGYICEIDSEDLATKLTKAKSIDSQACREFAKGYDWDEIATEMESYYHEAVSTTR
ncbi:glycosyltransferase family 4 protein [Halorubrum sp. RMP-47]|uniref:glycosyltransferase family 4 protein n=1 Tax=Halorubrum miltondacostae TaxID=3076378 RepID=UPI0035277A38